MTVLDAILTDLAAEGDQLRAAIAGLDETGWRTPVPAEGWTIAMTIAHLASTDEAAVLAANANAPEGKEAWEELRRRAMADPDGFMDKSAHELARLAPEDLLARWDAGRADLGKALQDSPEGQRIPWLGPPMSPTSMATARFMETWAHALDVYDTLGERPAVTDRIKHVAHLGVRTRNFSFAQNELEAPAEEFRVELTAPSGEGWAWGPEDAAQSVTGSAYDFCQLVTQRIHRDDTDLVAVGAAAEQWLAVAQAFAGPAGGGREATSR